MLWGNGVYVMTQANVKGGELCLPHGLCVANTCTEMTTWSKCVAVVIKKPDGCTDYYWQGNQDHLSGSCE